jgi:hypothetical protein
MKFWEKTWGDLAPGDFVQAPNGSAWKIGSAITHDGRGEWELIGPKGETVWTEHAESDPVPAWRDRFAHAVGVDVEMARGLLRLELGAEEISKEAAKVGPNAPRWLGCGQRVCRCR